MIRKTFIAALLAGSAIAFPAPAFAQEPPAAAGKSRPSPTRRTRPPTRRSPRRRRSTTPQAKIELLQAQVEALQEALEGIKAQMAKATPSWKGAPLFEDKDDGWSFKPRGRIQYDAGYVSNPRRQRQLLTRNLGFNTRVRRIRLGAEGTIPGGFGYKFEMDFANAAVGFGDVDPHLRAEGQAVELGHRQPGDARTASSRSPARASSRFIERAAFNDAFINTRRIGVSVGLVNKAGDMRFNAGLFAAHSIDGSFDNEGWIAAARGVYSPLMGGNQLHFGANFQHRKFQAQQRHRPSSTSVGAPSTNQLARYRARPFTPDDRRPLRRHRQFRRQERRHLRARGRPASSSRCTSPPKASI